MNRCSQGDWRLYEREDGHIFIITDTAGFGINRAVAEVLTWNVDDPKNNARLLVSAPQMHSALVAAVEALRATNAFLSGINGDTPSLDEIISKIDDLLDDIA